MVIVSSNSEGTITSDFNDNLNLEELIRMDNYCSLFQAMALMALKVAANGLPSKQIEDRV